MVINSCHDSKSKVMFFQDLYIVQREDKTLEEEASSFQKTSLCIYEAGSHMYMRERLHTEMFCMHGSLFLIIELIGIRQL